MDESDYRKRSVLSAIVGRHGVGKTSLIQAFMTPGSVSNKHTSPTIGAAVVNHKFKVAEGAEKRSHIIWDTAGQERYAALIPMYTRNCDIIMLAFPATEEPQEAAVIKLLADALPPFRTPRLIKGVITMADRVPDSVSEGRRERLHELLVNSPQHRNRHFEVRTYVTSAYQQRGVEDTITDGIVQIYRWKAEQRRQQEEKGRSDVELGEPGDGRAQQRCKTC
jgi:predicted GTPase